MSYCYNNYNNNSCRNSCRNNSSCTCNSCSGVGGANTGCNSCNSCSGVGGANTGCNSCNSCSGVGGANTGCNSCGGWRPPFHFPPQNSVCGTCPPGTRPCNSCWNPCWNSCGCGCNNCGCNNGGCNNNGGTVNPGTYAFFNSTGSTLTTGSIIPLRYVIGSGELGRGTTGGTVSLDSGVYSVEYSLNATADTAGATITVTPEYLGALHPEYSRSFTTSAADQTFDIAGSFVVNLPSDTTLSLNVTIAEPAATDTTTLTGVNASMLIRRISGCPNS